MWRQLVNLILGLWLMAAPAVLDESPLPAANDHIIGLLAALTGLVAAWEVTRFVRWANVLLGVWLILAPLCLGYVEAGPTTNDFGVGFLLILGACRKGKIIHRYGGGWSALWK